MSAQDNHLMNSEHDVLEEDSSRSAIDWLNHLIELNYDARDGYRAAATSAKNRTYAEMFQRYADDREKFILQLSNLVARYGGQPDSDGHLAAAAHRAWLNLQSAIHDDDTAILAECARGEAYALEAYQDAMAADLSDGVRDVIRKQLTVVRDAHDRVKALASALSE